MQFAGKHIVVSGGGRGIGAAFVARFLEEGACVSIFDVTAAQGDMPDRVQQIICNVGDEKQMFAAIETAESSFGPVDICVSNAGVLGSNEGKSALASDGVWDHCWQVNVMAHVYAARALLPGMIARGQGHFVTVASAAGLLNQIGDAAYSATKHAAVSFAESLAITHRDDGIGVTLVCPQYVATQMIGLSDHDAKNAESLLTADDVAQTVMQAMRDGRFLVLPHPDVHGYALARAQDHDRWISGMCRLRAKAVKDFGQAAPQSLYKLI